MSSAPEHTPQDGQPQLATDPRHFSQHQGGQASRHMEELNQLLASAAAAAGAPAGPAAAAPPLFHLPPVAPAAAAAAGGLQPPSAANPGSATELAALLGSFPHSLSTAAGANATLNSPLHLASGALDLALDLYPGRGSNLLGLGLHHHLGQHPTNTSQLLSALSPANQGLDLHLPSRLVTGSYHSGLSNPTTAALLRQEGLASHNTSAAASLLLPGGAGHNSAAAAAAANPLLQLPSAPTAAAAPVGANPYNLPAAGPAGYSAAAAGSNLGSDLAALLQDRMSSQHDRSVLTHGQVTTATGSALSSILAQSGAAAAAAAAGGIPGGSTLQQIRLQGGANAHNPLWVPQQPQRQQQQQGLQLPGSAALSAGQSMLLQQTIQARGGTSLQALLQQGQQQLERSAPNQHFPPQLLDANWLFEHSHHPQPQQLQQHLSPFNTAQLQQLQLNQHHQQLGVPPANNILHAQPPLAAEPASAAMAAAAAAAGAGDGSNGSGGPREAGPFISLHDNGAGPNGLYGVSKERAGAAVPLEAAGPDAKRDRAATARRALAQKGGKPTSNYRGVTHHVRTGRWEAHIWLEGKQVYLGGFDSEAEAAMAYDLAAVKFRGHSAQTNFSLSNYEAELKAMHQVRGDDLVAALRRQSRGPASTSSSFRGVTKHAKGRWEARIGRGPAGKGSTGGGRKYTYLGLYDTEIEAAMAYDRAAVKQKGLQAITNFDLANYLDELNPEELQHYMQNCPPEAMQAAAAASAAVQQQQQQQQEAAAAQAAAEADAAQQQALARISSRRGVATRRAAVAAAAAWTQEPVGLEDDTYMRDADQQYNAQAAAAAAAAAAAVDEQMLAQEGEPPNAAAARGSSERAAASSSSKSSAAASAGDTAAAAAAVGRAGRLTRANSRGRQSAAADMPSPKPRKAKAAAATGSSDQVAAAQSAEGELQQEQRQYSQRLLDEEQQQQQAELQQQQQQQKQQKKRYRRSSKAAEGSPAPTAAAAASPFARSASLDSKTAAAAGSRVHSPSPGRIRIARVDSDPKRGSAAAAAPGSGTSTAAARNLDLPPIAPLRRTVTAPPMSAQFISDLAPDQQPKEQADVNDFVMPDDDQDGTPGDSRPGGASGDTGNRGGTSGSLVRKGSGTLSDTKRGGTAGDQRAAKGSNRGRGRSRRVATAGGGRQKAAAAAAGPRLPTLRAAGVTANQLVELGDLDDYSSLSSSSDDSSDDASMKDTGVTSGPRSSGNSGPGSSSNLPGPQVLPTGPASQQLSGPAGLQGLVASRLEAHRLNPNHGHLGPGVNPILVDPSPDHMHHLPRFVNPNPTNLSHGLGGSLAREVNPNADSNAFQGLDVGRDLPAWIDADLHGPRHMTASPAPQPGGLVPHHGLAPHANPSPHCLHRPGGGLHQGGHYAQGPASYPGTGFGPLQRTLSMPMGVSGYDRLHAAAAASPAAAAAAATMGVGMVASPASAPAARHGEWQQQQGFGRPGSQPPWGYHAGLGPDPAAGHAAAIQHQHMHHHHQNHQAPVLQQQLYAPGPDGTTLVPIKISVVDGKITVIERPDAAPLPAAAAPAEPVHHHHYVLHNGHAAAMAAAAGSRSGGDLAVNAGAVDGVTHEHGGLPRLAPIRTQPMLGLHEYDASAPAAAAAVAAVGSSNSAAAEAAVVAGVSAAGRTVSAAANDMMHADPTAAAAAGGRASGAGGVERFNSHVVNNAQEAAPPAGAAAAAADATKQTTGQAVGDNATAKDAQGLEARKRSASPDAQQQQGCMDAPMADADQADGRAPDHDTDQADHESNVDRGSLPPKKRRRTSSDAGATAAAAILPTGPALVLAEALALPSPAAAAARSTPTEASAASKLTGPAPILAASAPAVNTNSIDQMVADADQQLDLAPEKASKVLAEPDPDAAALQDQAKSVSTAAVGAAQNADENIHDQDVDAVAHILETTQ